MINLWRFTLYQQIKKVPDSVIVRPVNSCTSILFLYSGPGSGSGISYRHFSFKGMLKSDPWWCKLLYLSDDKDL